MKTCPPRIKELLNELAVALNETPGLAKHVRNHPAFIIVSQDLLFGSDTGHTIGAPQPSRAFKQAAQKRKAAQLKLPIKAPEKWKGVRGPRPKGVRRESPSEFVRRVYGRYYEHGFSWTHLRRLDLRLHTALRSWEARKGPQSGLPKRHYTADALLAELAPHYPLDQLRRLGLTINSRMQRGIYDGYRWRPK